MGGAAGRGADSKNSNTPKLPIKVHRCSLTVAELKHTLRMEFGSSFVYAPDDPSAKEYEKIPESRYNRTVTGYASAASAANYKDDGEVRSSSGNSY